jgi:DNA replication protein DnaC
MRVVELLNHLTKAQMNGLLGKALKFYVRPDRLLVDELGCLAIDERGADFWFQLIAARYETGSIVVTTNRLFREWGDMFDVYYKLATVSICNGSA